MGTSTDAKLMYGYDLGDPEGGMKVKEYDEDSYELKVPWAESLHDEDADASDVVDTVLTNAGVTGVKLETYCSCDYPMYVLAAKTIQVYRGETMAIVRDDLRVPNLWDRNLAAALEALEITPDQAEPRWLLASLVC